MRRSVTITDQNHKNILAARASLMTTHAAIDIDYTTALNMFLAIGLRRFLNRNLTHEEVALIVEYMYDENLRREVLYDCLAELQAKENVSSPQYHNKNIPNPPRAPSIDPQKGNTDSQT